ncbi:MAG: alpha/beta fold hydrolase [Actinomycetia bacterium]|nr:alpha/beta fold hydrolase [Actinomycetes bacterium]
MPTIDINGSRTFYEVLNPAGTSTVVMIHGLFTNHLVFYQCGAEDLAERGCRVVLYDLRGHGLTAHRPDGFRLADLARDLITLMDQLGVAQPDIVGYSLGGSIALTAILGEPDRFGRLVLIDPFGLRRDDVAQASAALRASVFDGPARYWNSTGVNLSDRTATQFRQLAKQLTADGLAQSLTADAGFIEQAPLETVDRPVLILCGSRSEHMRDSQLVASRLPNARFVATNADHNLPITQGPWVARHIVDFLFAAGPAEPGGPHPPSGAAPESGPGPASTSKTPASDSRERPTGRWFRRRRTSKDPAQSEAALPDTDHPPDAAPDATAGGTPKTTVDPAGPADPIPAPPATPRATVAASTRSDEPTTSASVHHAGEDMDPAAAISVRGLRMSYGPVLAVKGISFDVAHGAFFSFLGVNGAGKSTTINCLTTLLHPTGGLATVAGHPLGRGDASIRRSIGVVFQGALLDPRLSVRENLELRARLHGLSPRRFPGRISELTHLLDMGSYAQRAYGRLSGGQKRRADIARALIHEPSVLFLDEPTAGLDPASRQQVWQAITDARTHEGVTVFLTTHYLAETERADTVCVIDEGTIIAEDTPARLRERFASALLDVRLRDELTAWLELRRRFPEVAPTRPPRPGESIRLAVPTTDVAKAILHHLWDYVDDFEFRHGSMDDVFLALTGRHESDETPDQPVKQSRRRTRTAASDRDTSPVAAPDDQSAAARPTRPARGDAPVPTTGARP